MTKVILHTSLGDVTLNLDCPGTPKTIENFVRYVKEGFYDGTQFHRVIKNFMIQGGGFDAEMNQKTNHGPIDNEAKTGLANKTGTISMARTNAPHSASSQFFINVADNDFLNFKSESPDGFGYCAFGRVTDGMDIVQKIAQVSTTSKQGHQDVPQEPVVILKTTVVD